ncbi:mitochondrial ornithine carrier protein [Rhodotorula kratochvilovae]
MASPDPNEGGAARSALKDIAYGSTAGIVSKLVEHPFDLTKVRLQSQPLDRPARYTGPWDCIVQTYRNEGLKAFWRGVSMPVAGAMAENATLFVVYNQTQALLQRLYPPATPSSPDKPPPLSIWQTATAAAIAGAAVSFVLTPVELVKCKMQVSNIAAEGFVASSAAHAVAGAAHAPAAKAIPASYTRPVAASPGVVAVTRSILREYGVRGLWLGQTGTLIRETGGDAAWFTTFELASRWFIERRVARGETSASGGRVTKGDLAAWELMSAGAGAGIMYNVILFPADCIKSTIQTEDELRGKGEVKGPKRGFLQVGKDIYQARGIRGLYNGCGITALRAAPSSALIFYIYSRLEAAFG